MSLKERVTLIREEKGLSVAAFAEKAGVTRQALYAAFTREKETGDHGIDLSTAQRLAKFSGRSLQWIQTGEEGTSALPAPERRVDLEPEAVAVPVDDNSGGSDPGLRYQALQELVDADEFDPAEALAAVSSIQFQRGRQVTWGDYYSQAKRALREQRKPGKVVGTRVVGATQKRSPSGTFEFSDPEGKPPAGKRR